MSALCRIRARISSLFKIALRHSTIAATDVAFFLHFFFFFSTLFFCFHSNICVNSFALNWIQSSNDETMFRHFFSYFASSHSSLVLCGFFLKPFFWGRTKDWKNRDEHFKCWSLTRLLFWRKKKYFLERRST